MNRKNIVEVGKDIDYIMKNYRGDLYFYRETVGKGVELNKVSSVYVNDIDKYLNDDRISLVEIR